MNIHCTDGILDLSINKNYNISIFPNPVQNQLNIQTPFDLYNAEVIIYNTLGQIGKRISNINSRNTNIETFDLPSGLYFIVLKNDGKQLGEWFLITK